MLGSRMFLIPLMFSASLVKSDWVCVMNPIRTPPFYALAIMVLWHDSYGGLRVNGQHQVVDMQGQVIPGLYAGGEAVGGFNKHGLGKSHVHGFIAGTHAAEEPSA